MSDSFDNLADGLTPEQLEALAFEMLRRGKEYREVILTDAQRQYQKDVKRVFKDNVDPAKVQSLQAELEDLQKQPMTRANMRKRRDLANKIQKAMRTNVGGRAQIGVSQDYSGDLQIDYPGGTQYE